MTDETEKYIHDLKIPDTPEQLAAKLAESAPAAPPAAMDGDGMLAEVIPPEAIQDLDRHVQALKERILKRLSAAANWVRMAICNGLGITYAMREFNRRVVGAHQDLAHLAKISNQNAELLKRLIEQTNANTRLLAAFERGYPMLGKIAAEMRAREAKAQKKVVSNGKIAGHIVDAGGRPIETSSRATLLEEVRKNFEAVYSNAGASGHLLLEEIWIEDGKLVGPPPSDPNHFPAGDIVVEWKGERLTVEDVQAVKDEQKRLLEEKSKTS